MENILIRYLEKTIYEHEISEGRIKTQETLRVSYGNLEP